MAAVELIEGIAKRVHKLGVQEIRKHNIIAYSGGVDSSLVAAVVHKVFPSNSIACIGVSAALSTEQLDQAREVADVIGIPLKEVHTTEGSDPDYIANMGASCFHCKTHLYSALEGVATHAAAASAHQQPAGGTTTVVLFNGTNAEDKLDSTRVGLRAAEDFRVASPIDHLLKDQVREAAKALGLPNWAHAASPCLRSRLAFGVPATAHNLARVESAEAIVRQHVKLSASNNLRVRSHAEDVATIEVDNSIIEDVAINLPSIQDELLVKGFKQVNLKVFKSGSVAHVSQDESVA
mmetsp:Transcript_4656/g.6959  ORF Transcript_4656/g.6959 Transcript_4656/m.6959 type:complete len:293 (-) Transcript_4656:42-920(-)|eukprot:CAMPEP_0113933932 /NCGR_PEP_ID=MMETSP1339-20121228/1285_1 /TAXON_ID=94617 /ORGANISM="Fibrocapsa japonica" /LENGTH=292 /DNA_ID=CAMNT_0000935501 /DNA_START=104 /DNA_END=982 /DNA_ORIENTATION=+ /assembly_acc=CAM_ASM_000762